MVDYANAIKKPFDDVQTAVIGIILGFIPIVSLLVSGFGIGVGRATLKGDNKLPKWDTNQIVQYVKDFVMVLIINIIYLIPALILLIVGGVVAGGAFLAAISSGTPEALVTAIMAALAAGGIFIILALVLGIVGSLLGAMGIMYYIKEGSIGAAFNFGGIIKKILTGTFWITLIVAVIYMIVLGIIAGLISIIPVIGVFIGSGLAAYAGTVTIYTMLAQVFKETP